MVTSRRQFADKAAGRISFSLSLCVHLCGDIGTLKGLTLRFPYGSPTVPLQVKGTSG